jgi:hypothetical protein
MLLKTRPAAHGIMTSTVLVDIAARHRLEPAATNPPVYSNRLLHACCETLLLRTVLPQLPVSYRILRVAIMPC